MVDLSPILDVIVQLLAAGLMGLGSWAIARLSTKLKLSSDSEVRKYLQEALERGVSFAVGVASEKSKDLSEVEVRNEMVRDAANYVITKTPDALKSLGVTDEAVQDLVRARLATVT